ncbi:uncharacterized protein LOC133191517 [Saccostrea echinata]|uniref:uncharacterized protein LOC133191517 n=1 Tax=Saccostrea echinata TaxID=191078 RepID=UPI002A7F315D|nr:uncharacterized protein LOC133191517 [Saccostrea echinata]
MASMNQMVLNSLCVLALCTIVLGGFSVEKFCEKACNRGLGGNLCRCNGFHFAGKRTVLNDILPVPNKYSTLYKEEEMEERKHAPTFTNDLEPLRQNFRREQLTTTDKIKEAQMFVQWLLDHVDILKSDIPEKHLGTYGIENEEYIP